MEREWDLASKQEPCGQRQGTGGAQPPEETQPAGVAQANLPAEEADAVLDELVATASRMAAEKAAEWSRVGIQESERRKQAFAEALLRQEDELKNLRPEFDLEEMLRTSLAFRALVLAGEPVERAYAYARPAQDAPEDELIDDEALEAGAQEMAEPPVMAAREPGRKRPQSMGLTGRPAQPSAEERLDDEEIGRIDAQLKRGRKVHLNY